MCGRRKGLQARLCYFAIMHVSGLQHQDERAAVSIADGVELCVAAAFGDAGTMRQAPCIIPLAIRKRNGRPEILPPTDPAASNDAAVETHVLRAVANAWSWQRKLEAGQASTNLDLARTQEISDRYIGRMIKLAYLPRRLSRNCCCSGAY